MGHCQDTDISCLSHCYSHMLLLVNLPGILVCVPHQDICAKYTLIFKADWVLGVGVEKQGSDCDETNNGGWVRWR